MLFQLFQTNSIVNDYHINVGRREQRITMSRGRQNTNEGTMKKRSHELASIYAYTTFRIIFDQATS